MAKQYTIVKRAGTTLLYVEKGCENTATAKKLNLQGFLYHGLRAGMTITFKGLPQAKNLRVVRANGVERALFQWPDTPVDTIPATKKATKATKKVVDKRKRVVA